MHAQFTKLKINLGDLELTKQNIIKEIDSMKADFSANEKELIEKYGADAVINIKTGQITRKN
jgi:hypothetical protein